MSTPPFVPPPPPTRLSRRSDFAGIPPARRASPRRGEVLAQPHGPGFGVPCPDAGYAFLLAHHSEHLLILESREHCQDANWAIAIVAVRHAGGLGRAPCIHDVALGRTVLAYDGGGPVGFCSLASEQSRRHRPGRRAPTAIEGRLRGTPRPGRHGCSARLVGSIAPAMGAVIRAFSRDDWLQCPRR